MEGISQYLRLRTATVVAALLAAAAVMMAASASANALVYANDISIRVVDNTPHHSMSAAFCPNGHVSIDYQFGTRADPCNVTPFVVPYIDANGGRYPQGAWPGTTYTANPLGVVIRLHGISDPFYFYAKNPILGLPFFQASQGGSCSVASPCTHTKYQLVQGELKTVRVGSTYVRFHREGDINGGLTGTSYKVMTIEICGASPAYCR